LETGEPSQHSLVDTGKHQEKNLCRGGRSQDLLASSPASKARISKHSTTNTHKSTTDTHKIQQIHIKVQQIHIRYNKYT